MSAKQSEFRLGPVGVIEGGLIPCQGCGYALPGAAILCPVCGFERAPYPAGTFRRFDWVLNQTPDSTAKLVLLALVSHDRPHGKGIYPSHARLAQLTGLGRRTVIDAIARLRASGWVSQEQTRHRRGQQSTNRYRVHQPGQAECGSCTQQGAVAAHEGLRT